jgi:ferredoxin
MTKIYYFSATGNSLWSARKISQGLSDTCELINIGVEAQKSEIVVEADAAIFVFPSYAFGLPLIVRSFAKRAVFKTPYVAAFVTYGSAPLGTLGELKGILKKKGIAKMFFYKIPAVENYLAMFGTPKTETIKSRTLLQEKATKYAIRSVIEQRENTVSTFRPFSAFVSWLFSLGAKIFYKMYRISGNCNGCAVCEKVCPVSAIVMKDGVPQFTSKCEHCQACVNLCPLRVIQFGRVKFGTQGYCHPEIKIEDLNR